MSAQQTCQTGVCATSPCHYAPAQTVMSRSGTDCSAGIGASQRAELFREHPCEFRCALAACVLRERGEIRVAVLASSFRTKDESMHLYRSAIVAAAFCAACGTSEGSQTGSDSGLSAEVGADRPRGDSAADSSPPEAAAELDSGPAEHGEPADADGGAEGSADSGICGDGVSCTDCNGRQYCVSGPCPKVSCPTIDASPPRACGSQACGANQICVHPSCGGGTPVCIPRGDAGTCPSGYTSTSSCPGQPPGTPMCVPPPCTDPPSFCAEIPAQCEGNLTCSCLPANVCQGHGLCTLRGAAIEVFCMSA